MSELFQCKVDQTRTFETRKTLCNMMSSTIAANAAPCCLQRSSVSQKVAFSAPKAPLRSR